MTKEFLLSILAAAGGLSFLGTILNALLQRRRLKAEAEKVGVDAAAVLTKSALSLLEVVRGEAQETRDELIATRRELSETRRELSALRRHLVMVEDSLRGTGISIPAFVWPTSGSGLTP